jgi:hypothetical protein
MGHPSRPPSDRRGFSGGTKALLLAFALALLGLGGGLLNTGPQKNEAPSPSRAAGDGIDGIARQKLDFLSRETAAGVGEGLKQRFLAALKARAADPANAGKPLQELMLLELSENPGAYLLKGDPVPLGELQKLGAFSRVIGLGTIFNHHLSRAAKDALFRQGITTATAFTEAVARDPGRFDAKTMLDPETLLSGKFNVGWWSPRGAEQAGSLAELVKELALDPNNYRGGAVRVTVDPATAVRLGFRKPTALDGIPFKEWTEAPPGSLVGRTAGGNPEVVAPGVRLGDVSQIEFFK